MIFLFLSLQTSFEMSKLLRSLSCGTIRRRPPTNYKIDEPTTKAAAATSSSKKEDEFNFWDIDGYGSTLDRCNDGNDLCENLIEMLNDRAKVEENYAKSLLQWQKKWTDFMNKESKEYGSSKVACLSMLQTSEKIAEYHTELQASIIDKSKSPIAEIKSWMKKNYSKDHIHFKKRNEFDEQFMYAQKPWSDYFKELKKTESKYHNSVKESSKMDQDAKKAEKNPKVKEEERAKMRKEADQYLTLQKKELKKYEDQLKLAEKFKQNYLDDMKKVFERTQDFELLRMQFFKEIYSQFKACVVNSNIYDGKVKEVIFKDFNDKVGKMDPSKDVKWWSDNYGAGMSPQWPSFVEFKF
jgi:hypothetical protein